MAIFEPFGIILITGAFGGLINAILSENGFILPHEEASENVNIIIPGVIANILTGAAAGFVFWGLTEANTMFIVYGPIKEGAEITLTVYGVAMALLAGIAGARYLTNEVDKRLLKAAAANAAASKQSTEESEKIANASPMQAFRIARRMLHRGEGRGIHPQEYSLRDH
jgi:hypothetical protein